MEVFFLDVGQASCNVILLGNREAIIIDSGSGKGSLPLKFFKRCRIDRIAALVLTHNHADHIGGATSILGDYRDCVDRIWFVDDGSFVQSQLYSRIRNLVDEKVLSREHLCRLECGVDPTMRRGSDSCLGRLISQSCFRHIELLGGQPSQRCVTIG